ncbi:MAG TPA: hypothetical protein VF604_07995 [Pyrinomonadaceae bacterium]|jgi:hypothetical protein
MSEKRRIRGLEKAPLAMKLLYLASKKMVGKVVEPLKVQAHRPSIAWFGNLLGLVIEKSGKVEARIHVLAQLRAAQIVECPF